MKPLLSFLLLLLVAGCATRAPLPAPAPAFAVLAPKSAEAIAMVTPVYLTVSNASPTVSLAWDYAPNVWYNIYFGVSPLGYTNKVFAGTSTNITITLPGRGVTYYFAATASSVGTDSSGVSYTLESGFSTEVSFTPMVPPAPPVMHKPVVLIVETKSDPAAAQWVDAGMNWSFDPDQTNAVFRLRIVAEQ